jgi:hypothetical protein
MHRRFYPVDETHYWDWPNFQRAYPLRIWFDQAELADVTVNQPVVTTGGQLIPYSAIFWGPWNYGPPYTYMELDRSQSYAFGVGNTPQRDVVITGTFGWSIETDLAGTLATAISDTTGTTVIVSNAAVATIGHILIADSERMIVSDHAAYDTTQSLQGGGGTTVSNADDLLTVANGADLNVDEIILIDAERMLIVDINGNAVTVKRAWDGTVLAAHDTGAEIYAYRQLTVLRGQLGTTAATHDQGITLYTHHPPYLIRDLAIAEAGMRVLQETGGYAGPQGEEVLSNLARQLTGLWDDVTAGYGRKARRRVV